MHTAVQLWTLRNLDVSTPALLDRVAAAGYDGVEFAGIEDPPETARAMDEVGLVAAGAHVDADELRADPAGVAAELDTLGVPSVVVPYLDPDHFIDTATVDETAAMLDALASEFDRPLLYHNHDHEFVPVGTETAFDRLAAETAVGFELDVGWAEAAGRDPAALLSDLAGRAPVVHLKDVTAAGEPTELGEGVVDLPGVVEAARDAGTEWLVFEHDDPADPMASVENGIEVVERVLEQ
ncbi:sugar phosphate isomerase/epimerase [Halomicroarcula sp. S1AR25-4]|uniref:sugar phosphate isomerase/epimerase family protein n=1 Tax=Haloarcula sp. S1AR25-4 TaxID=2950538 RepID=UPI0028743107|nr:sugar phosphate isomerase/epimerase [Halomicroarcula sp. S1AR25-4]MDS0278133.1 sugar phosphate isomerase/epimerase [Halomicroarcula sp. S1AR25-4]